jgi:16S rRNA processing protein RimM
LTSERVPIGYVVRAHGVRGALRVRSEGDALERLRRVFVDGREMEIAGVQRERGDFLVRLVGVDNRDQAQKLRGAALMAARSDLPAAREDEVYVFDLIGCSVFDADGRPLGEVTDVFHSGAHETLVVGELLIPFVDAIVKSVDLANRRIVCDPPEGLLELDKR